MNCVPEPENFPVRTVLSEELQVRFHRTIPADIELIDEVVAEVMGLVSRTGCAVNKEFEVEVSLREALANAVLHGCKGDQTKQVTVWVACADSLGVLVVVRDPGEGFDPASIPSPVVGENVFQSHGRGIFLINQLMDEVRFERGGTEIHMLKRRTG
jgi:serine/threonine-protein kinase RsbW